MRKKMNVSAVLAASLLAAAVLAGCGRGETVYAAQEADSARPVSSSSAKPESQPESSAASEEKRLLPSERLKLRMQEAWARKKGQETKAAAETSAAPKFGSVEAIAALGDLEATVQEKEKECLVYIFDETKNHGNPYDVTWDYGKTYDSYVEAADWSLVFDAKYYKSTFPMLAMLYHDDDALLLKHFQTVGIHEGRQGSKNFNVAAYKANCSKAVRDAFGDNYECYYLYYLLHQDTESGVKATGAYKKQLAQEFTVVQAKELKGVNWFREEVDVGTVEFDSEMAVLANYRAYMDCIEGWDAHDGLDHMMDTGELDGYMDTLGMGVYCENKDTNGCYTGKEHVFSAVSDYRASKGHYETMVDPDYAYVGCSNFYVSDKDYNWSGELDNNVITFDTYADAVTTAYHTK